MKKEKGIGRVSGVIMEGSWTGIVDIGSKPVVAREAIATGILTLSSEGLDLATNGRSAKGDVCESSTVAAIQAVKEAPRTLPHCHPIPIEGCTVDWKAEEGGLRCTVSVRTHWSTGVEMEALCGVSAGLLCAWDMLKPIEKDNEGQYPDAKIEDVRVIRKSKGDPQD
jgi:cyclic pyranopterin phosphate synthase